MQSVANFSSPWQAQALEETEVYQVFVRLSILLFSVTAASVWTTQLSKL